MAKSSAHIMSYLVETTIGTTPNNPRFTKLPDTKTTLAMTRDTLESTRETGSRFMAAPRLGALGVSGDIPAQLSYAAYDDLLASALQGTWTDTGGVDVVDIEIDTVSNSMAAGDNSPTTNGIVTLERLDSKREEVVLRYDPTILAPASSYVISGLGSVTIDSEVFEVVSYTDQANSAVLLAGDTQTSFSVLREFSDFEAGKKPFNLFSGVEVSTLNISASANGSVEATFGMFGQGALAPSETGPANNSSAPAINTDFYDTFSGEVKLDGVAVCDLTELSLSIDNGLAPRYAIGCPNSGDPSVGDSVVTGSFTSYLQDETLLEKFFNEEGLTLEVTFAAPNGDGITINLPNLKLLSGTQADVGDDPDVHIPVNFSAHYDETLGSHISITRNSPLAV